MANVNSAFGLFAVFLLATIVSSAPGDRATAEDVHLNTVLPEGEISSKIVPIEAEIVEQVSAASADAPHLELESELTTKSPSSPTNSVPNHTYFSRVITSIFEIPIAVLTAVRNLVQTATTPKVPAV
ncbi:uncharacterized protein LOC143915403 [Arctopsyche grandis]|uniref:uncharacterized protein LOC143915403 n=1 Tax=Arctopsyche grandis TaxID=121162 RepID=UPI00406D7262